MVEILLDTQVKDTKLSVSTMEQAIPYPFFLIGVLGFLGGSVVKNPPANAGDAGKVDSIPGLGRSPGVGNGNPLQYSCLENSMDRGTWWATVHEVRKNWTQQSSHT